MNSNSANSEEFLDWFAEELWQGILKSKKSDHEKVNEQVIQDQRGKASPGSRDKKDRGNTGHSHKAA